MSEESAGMVTRIRNGVRRRVRRRVQIARHAVARKPRLPSFFILGAQKAGTTWLHEMLGHHPDVFLPKPKELHFFDHRHRYKKGIDWYASHYATAPRRARLGEATPNYLWASDHLANQWTTGQFDASWKFCTPERIAVWTGPQTRFVVLLRDPVARAVSGFFHHVRVGGRLDPEAPFLENGKGWGIIHMGFYAAHLERYWEVFDRDRFLVLLFEDVIREPQKALDQVTAHLRLKRLQLPDEVLRSRVHGGRKFRDDDGVYYFDEEHTRVAIRPQDLEELRGVYAPENERLERLLGRDLSSWERKKH